MVAGTIVLPRQEVLCVDIILRILQHFEHREWGCDRDGLEVERTSSLSRFARTCRAFFSLAVPILWRRLRSLLPLLRLSGLPTNMKGQAGHMVNLAIYPYAWCRLCAYATFVEELDATHAECPPDPFVWDVLRRLTRGRPFLPSLRVLRWRITSVRCTALVYLISPSLRKLVIQCSPPPGPLSSMERLEWGFALWMPLALALPIPRLTHISLSYSGFHAPAVFYPLSKLASLQSFRLSVDCGTYGVPIVISDLFFFLDTEHLQHLDVNFKLATSNDARCNRHLPSVTALRSLSIPHGPGSNQWYPRFASPLLTRLTIHHYLDDTLADFHTTCAIWALHFPSLQNFSCSLAPTLTGPLRVADTIGPLLRLRDVRSFSLTFGLGAQLTACDADLVDVAQSWPRLTSFALVASSSSASEEPSWDAEGVEGPGFGALEAFRTHCPVLERLWLPHFVLRTRDFNPVPAGKHWHAPREGEGEHGLREVVARWIDADDWQLAAALVDRLFPCLDLDNRAALWGNVLGEVDGDEDEDEDGEEM